MLRANNMFKIHIISTDEDPRLRIESFAVINLRGVSTNKTIIHFIAMQTCKHTKNCDITFLTMFILTHPVNFPCGRKPERPEKTHDFRESVD